MQKRRVSWRIGWEDHTHSIDVHGRRTGSRAVYSVCWLGLVICHGHHGRSSVGWAKHVHGNATVKEHLLTNNQDNRINGINFNNACASCQHSLSLSRPQLINYDILIISPAIKLKHLPYEFVPGTLKNIPDAPAECDGWFLGGVAAAVAGVAATVAVVAQLAQGVLERRSTPGQRVAHQLDSNHQYTRRIIHSILPNLVTSLHRAPYFSCGHGKHPLIWTFTCRLLVQLISSSTATW